MEQNEIASWKEVHKIDRIRCAHAQRHVTQQGHPQVKISLIQTNPLLVYILIRICAVRNSLVKQKGCFVNMFVLLARLQKETLIIVHRLIEGKQRKILKMNRFGYGHSAVPYSLQNQIRL